MDTKQSQIKINLSSGLKNKIEKRAKEFDLTLAGFAKYLFIKDLEESDKLDFSKRTWKHIENIKTGKEKIVKVENTKKFFDKMRATLKK